MVSKNRRRLWLDFGRMKRNSAVNLIQINCAFSRLICIYQLRAEKNFQNRLAIIEFNCDSDIYIYLFSLMQTVLALRFHYHHFSSSFFSLQFIHLFDGITCSSRGILIRRGKFPLYQINVCSRRRWHVVCLFVWLSIYNWYAFQFSSERLKEENQHGGQPLLFKVNGTSCVCIGGVCVRVNIYFIHHSVIFGTSTMSKFARTQINKESDRERGR